MSIAKLDLGVVSIFGSGFGLYGHLPAVWSAGAKAVLLPVRYREVFEGRLELSRFRDVVEWVSDESRLFSHAKTVVLARTPFQNYKDVGEVLRYTNIRNLVTEKPPAPAPAEAQLLPERLKDLNWRVPFQFRYLPWFGLLVRSAETNKIRNLNFSVRWSFKAHHFQNGLSNWKSFHKDGGGPLRFYAIHLVNLAAELGFLIPLSAQKDEATWTATFQNEAGTQIAMCLDSNSESDFFKVASFPPGVGDERTVFHSETPFSKGQKVRCNESAISNDDPRVASLTKVYTSFSESNKEFVRGYSSTFELWDRVEKLEF